MKGSAVLSGVEMYNMGKSNSDKAGLYVLKTFKDESIATTILDNSSMYGC